MTQGEVLIAFLLALIAWFLYQIARQLSYLTGRKVKFSLFNKELYNGVKRKFAQEKKKKSEREISLSKLPN